MSHFRYYALITAGCNFTLCPVDWNLVFTEAFVYTAPVVICLLAACLSFYVCHSLIYLTFLDAVVTDAVHLNMALRLVLLASASLFGSVVSQFPPTPEGLTTINSKFDKDITISYKEA